MYQLTKYTAILLILVCANALVAEEQDIEATQELAAAEKQPSESSSNKNWGILGMNVRGNKESPMSLNIVPWRSAAHEQLNPEVRPGWQPKLILLQPEAYRREINAFLKSKPKSKSK